MLLVFALLFLVMDPVNGFSGVQQWTSAGPYGGSFQSFVFHPTDDNVIFASELNALFRSTDRGRTWKRLEIPGGEFSVRIHPRNPSLILATGSSRAVYASQDLGNSWVEIYKQDFQNDFFYDMEFHPADPKTLYAVTFAHGVFKSTDRGRSWSGKNSGLNLRNKAECCIDLPQLEVDPKNGKVVYVLLPSRLVFKSENGGEKWKSASFGLKFTDEVHALKIDPKNNLILYAGGSNGIFHTSNAGLQWSSRHCNCYIWSFAVNPSDHKEVYGVGQGALKSVDGGKTWEGLSPHPFLSGILLGVAVHPKDPNLIFVGGFGGGIFRSQDSGRSWKTVNENLDSLQAAKIISDPAMKGRFFVVAGQEVYETRDHGTNWELFLKSQASGFWVSDLTIHKQNPKLIVAAGYRRGPGGAVTISADGGKTWSARSPYQGVNYGCSSCAALDPRQEQTIYVSPFQKSAGKVIPLGIAKSTDQGKTWNLINSGLTALDVWVLSIDPKNSSVVYAGTGTGKIFKSANAGASWSNISNGLDRSSIRQILPDSTNSDIIYAATSSGVFKSNNGGEDWSLLKNGLPVSSYNFIDATPTESPTLFAGGDAGIFVSKDEGDSWSRFDSNGLGTFDLWSLMINPYDPKTFFLGTDRGIFSYTAKDSSLKH